MGAYVLKFWGVRGSMPVAEPAMSRYGGNTPCLELPIDDRTRILFDVGTGVCVMANSLPEPGPEGYDFHVFFTHYHLDHILGLPFFRPLYDERNTFTFYGHTYEGTSVQNLVESVMAPPLFPIHVADAGASLKYVELAGQPISLGDVVISTSSLQHPQGVTAFRIDNGSSIVVATDYERGEAASDLALDRLAAGCDILVHDAQYTPAERSGQYAGWGHSSWLQATEAASTAQAGQLIMVSHDPSRTDAEVDDILALARAEFPDSSAAYEGMTVTL